MKCTCQSNSTWLRNVNKVDMYIYGGRFVRGICVCVRWMEAKTGKVTDRFVLHFAQCVSGAFDDVLMCRRRRFAVCADASIILFSFFTILVHSRGHKNAAHCYQRITSNWFYVKCFGDIYRRFESTEWESNALTHFSILLDWLETCTHSHMTQMTLAARSQRIAVCSLGSP